MTFRNNKICYGESPYCTNILGKKYQDFFMFLLSIAMFANYVYMYILYLDKDDFYKYTYITKFFIFLHIYLFLSTFFNCYIFTLETFIYTLVFITRYR